MHLEWEDETGRNTSSIKYIERFLSAYFQTSYVILKKVEMMKR